MSQFNKPLARKPYTTHPDDSFLEVVLHTNFKGEYVTHVLNKQTGGFGSGHYHGHDLTGALKDFNSRGVETLLNEGEIVAEKQKVEVAALLEVIRLQSFALETIVSLAAHAVGAVAREEIVKYLELGKKTLRENGIED